MTRKPSYRFAGYIEPWEEKKLGEIVERITRKNKNLESDLPLTISAQYGLIDQETFFNKKVASKDVSGYYLLKKGEFAYNKSYSSDYPWGAVKRLDNYEMGVLSTLYIVFRPNSIDSDFLAVYYDSPKWYKEVSMRAAEGARNHGLLNISPQDFFDTELIFPVNQSEQTAIGSFFQDIDQLISLQQRKLEVLKEQKKTYLKPLFPAKGQTKPALRFAGFEDEWKEKYLYEVLKVSKDRNVDLAYDKNQVLSVSREAGVVNQIEYQGRSFAGADLSNYKVVNKENLIYTKSPLKGAPYGIFQISYTTGIVSPLYAVFKSTKQIFAPFVGLSLMDDNKASKYLSPIVTKGAKNTINITDEGSLQGKLLFPSMEEQRIIHTFFQDLDKSIAKQEEKVNQLKESKQTLLRKMFI